MEIEDTICRIAIVGGGPSGLFMYKRLIESNKRWNIDIFEKKQILGAGMPYSRDGALDEHITNVSGNEIPKLVTGVEDWLKTQDRDTLNRFHIDADNFNDYKVLPRLLFGRYLSDQFWLLEKQAKEKGLLTTIHYCAEVTDIIDSPREGLVTVIVNQSERFEYDRVIICTGHYWPKDKEDISNRYFESPYPPSKLAMRLNHPVAIRGSSLTAIDAIRTLARNNGEFQKDKDGKLSYQLDKESEAFRIVLHSRNGMLPAVRFHLEDSHLAKDSVLSDEEIAEVRDKNDGFLPLDYIFQKNFLDRLQAQEPEFYERVKQLGMEGFVAEMMSLRESVPPFLLLKGEYVEAAKSIDRQQSIYWKEMLAVLSFAMNYPAKYFSAEDMLRLQKTLMPLISIVIAFVPQSSVAEMLALHEAGLLDIVAVGDDSSVEVLAEGGVVYRYTNEEGKRVSLHFGTFIDCVGQPHLLYRNIPFPSLINNRTISPAKIMFRDQVKGEQEFNDGNEKVVQEQGEFYLQVPGIRINDYFQVVDAYGALNERIYMMAVPFIGGYNPDYSGLDFGEAASARILKRLMEHEPGN